jgi:chromosome segregation ATPase
MKRIIILMLMVVMALPQMAQTRHRTSRSKHHTQTTVTRQGKSRSTRQQTATSSKTRKGKANYTTSEIRGLQSQRQQIEKDIRDQQNKLRANKENVANRLNDLMILNGEIDAKQKDIEGFEMEIKNLDGNIGILKSQMNTLQGQLKDRQEKYVKSMRYMAKKPLDTGQTDVYFQCQKPHTGLPAIALRPGLCVLSKSSG